MRKYYIDPITKDLLSFSFEDKELIILERIDKVRILSVGEVVEDEDYIDRGKSHPGVKNTKLGADSISQKDRIKDLLAEGKKAAEIISETGISPGVVYSIISRLKKDAGGGDESLEEAVEPVRKKQRGRVQVTPELVFKIKELLTAGKSVKEVSEETGLSVGPIYKFKNDLNL